LLVVLQLKTASGFDVAADHCTLSTPQAERLQMLSALQQPALLTAA
jgi:hypothetical protein